MGIFTRGNMLWITYKDVDGKWKNRSTGHKLGEERQAQEKHDAVVAYVASLKPIAPPASSGSVRAWADEWIPKRRRADLDWKNDRSRLEHHVFPTIGDMRMSDIEPRHIVELVELWRFTTKLAQRTVYNVYSVVSAMFRDAALAGVIKQSPCILTDAQLGPLIDKDPEWRAEAVFARDEAGDLISDERIPFDRRVYYAFGLLAGLRPGEIAALRVRHYESKVQPLGRLTVAFAHNTRKNTTKRTKTNAVRRIPVHPVLAVLLDEWMLRGWQAMCGRAPNADDLLLPLPPTDAARRRSRTGEAIRTGDYAGKKWREVDLPMLGWRDRELYATKSTFITLAIEDGADPDVIRERVTHAKPRKDAFDGYDRGEHWTRTCAEVAKLGIELTRSNEQRIALAAGAELLTSSLQPGESSENNNEKSGGGGSRRGNLIALPSVAGTGFRHDGGADRISVSGTDRVSVQSGDVMTAMRDAIVAALRVDARRARREVLKLLADLE